MIFSCVINLLIHCLFSAVLMLASQVFFKGHMEYAIISFSVGKKISLMAISSVYFLIFLRVRWNTP